MNKFIILLSVLFSMNCFANVSLGIQGHTRGDVIALQHDDEIIRWCDFNKSIVKTAENVLCVYNGKTKSDLSHPFQ